MFSIVNIVLCKANKKKLISSDLSYSSLVKKEKKGGGGGGALWRPIHRLSHSVNGMESDISEIYFQVVLY